MNGIKIRLAIMNFLEFAVWGSYLTCLGNYLGGHGLGSDIALFYSVQGIVSMFMPALIGIIADKYMQPQKVLGLCQLLAGFFMAGAWYYGMTHPVLDFWPFFCLYMLSVAFFMPTIALANTVAFSLLRQHGLDTVKDFPPIRVLGTVGFIAAMWFVNCFYISDVSFGFSLENPLGGGADPRFQYSVNQLLTSAILSVCLCLFCLTLPKCPIAGKGRKSQGIVAALGLDAFKLFKRKKMAMFFIFSMLLGVSLQITNGFATPFISSFKAVSGYLNSFGANNATLLTSLSQISEALCILLIPFFLRRFGIKRVVMIAMMAWVLRFGFFGLGNPGSGVWLFILSMIVYGVAFDFFNVSGALFVEQEAPASIRASAQGLFMLMTNGIGATFGTLAAGVVVNHYCHWTATDPSYQVGDWSTVWYIFAAYALVVFVLFTIFFKYKHVPERITRSEAADDGGGDPEGMADLR